MPKQGFVLFIDAYDSFAENIAALLQQELNVVVELIHIDCDVQAQFDRDLHGFFAGFDAIVLGPGPGNPQNELDVGLFNQVWDIAVQEQIPVLGICLGFQSLCVQYGMPIVRMGLPCHGHSKQIIHDDQDIFEGSGEVFATNYNSLGIHMKKLLSDPDFSRTNSTMSVSSLSSSRPPSLISEPSMLHPQVQQHSLADQLQGLAWDKEQWLMAVKHRSHPFHGFQFHPESCKSNSACPKLLRRWWDAAQAHNLLLRPSLKVGFPENALDIPCPVSGKREHVQLIERRLLELTTLCKPGSGHEKSVNMSSSEYLAALCYETSQPHGVVMLESTRKGRYSIYAFPNQSTFRIEYAGGFCKLWQETTCVEDVELKRDEMVNILESLMSIKASPWQVDKIPFLGGFMGFMSYEFGTASISVRCSGGDTTSSQIPEMSLMWVDRSVVFDHQTGMAYVQSLRSDDRHWVNDLAAKLNAYQELEPPTSENTQSERLQKIHKATKFSLPDHDLYVSQIRECQSELLAGNSYELCLTTEAEVATPTGPDHSWLLYKNIQRHNPVPFAAFIQLNKITILSSSPEQFLSWNSDRSIDMVPMKGTVKKSAEMTRERATAILASAKESAENLMIADLIRHDLYSTVGRDSLVEVVKLCDVVETETVFTLVSHIRAHVPQGTDSHSDADLGRREMTRYGIEALSHALPPGSMTGAPKKRSCEILQRLEQRDRGVYSGAIGYMDVGGRGAWSVCIRTAFATDDDIKVENGRKMQTWRIGAGGAITVLSDEEQEWEEMMTKLDSVMRGFRPDSAGSL